MSISCLVCLGNFETTEEVVSISRCGHVFHLDCLNGWRSTKQNLSNACPLCRVTYRKNHLKKLFFGVAESEQNSKEELLLKKLEEEKHREICEKQKYKNELCKVQMELGIKHQAYNIIDSVNNEYLQNNQKLKEQNEQLLAESNRIKEEMEKLKKKLAPPPHVDLTEISDDDDDDDIEFVSETKIQKIIEGVVEINDECDDDVQIIPDCANPQQEATTNEHEQGHRIQPIEVVDANDLVVTGKIQDIPPIKEEGNEVTFDQTSQSEPQSFFPDNNDDDEPLFKKPRLSTTNDFSFLNDYILSQI